MKEDPLYLHRKHNGVYQYRRPVVAEDQEFWLGPNGTPKKEWSRSLRTKDRREAIDLMPDAADAYTAEREAQFQTNGPPPQGAAIGAAQGALSREREEQAARAAVEADRLARYEARAAYRVLARQRMMLSTAELDPQEAAWRDLAREDHQELEMLRQARDGQQAANDAIAKRMGKAPASTGRTVEKLIEAYEADKSPGWSGSSKKAVTPVFRLLRDVFKGREVESITRHDARRVVTLLGELPTQIGKRRELVGLTIQEAVDKGRALGLPTIQPKTINDGYLLHIASMWNWAVREQWLASSPFSGLSVHDPIDDAERRDPFTIDQLKTLFSRAPWDRPWARGGEKPGAYWVPLLCLFHGLRNGEAAGLRVEDISEDDGVPVLRIRGYEGRTLKTKGSRGSLPIHPELIRIGWLEFVAGRRDDEAELLFPEGVANGRGQVGAKLAERFSARVKALGFVGRKLGTHSFRHCFEDQLRAAELPERTALALARRTEAGSSRVYGDGLAPRQKAEAIARIEYPGLDLSHIYAPQGAELAA